MENFAATMAQPGYGFFAPILIGMLAGWLAERLTSADHGLFTNRLGGVAGSAGPGVSGPGTAGPGVLGPGTAGLDLAGLDLAGLDTAPMVNFDRRDDLQHRFLRGIGGRATDVPRHHIPTSADFARAVLLGLGWGLLPEQQCLTELGDGRLRDLAPGHPIDVVLYWQRWNIASRLLDQVTNAVRRVAAASLHL